MRKTAVLHLVGLQLVFISNLLLLPMLVALCYDDAASPFEARELSGFVLAAALSLVCGVVLWKLFPAQKEPIGAKEGFGVVCISWLVVAFFGCLPYYHSGALPNFIDAYFETMSGFSTTGASVIDNVEILPHGLLFWRAMTHWIGGMGIIVLAIAVFPALGVAGYNLFRAESSAPTFKRFVPRIADTARILWEIYLLLTLLEILVLLIGGMDLFDAVCHTFATVATGGFSTRNKSMGAFSPFLQYSVMFFMLLAGINFSLHFGLIRGKVGEFLRNSELRFFLGIQLVAAVIIVAVLLAATPDAPVEETVRSGIFYTVSIGTCTGFCTVDYEQWPHICRLVLMILMFIGACSGSTTGALKSVRLLVMLKSVGRAIRQLINPRAVMVVKLGDTPLDERVVSGVAIFVCIYLLTFMVASVCLVAQGLDIVTAAGSVASNMGGVGPGFGLTGPMTTYSQIPIVGKGILIACMLMGRLEIFGVLVLFSASAWRK